MENPQKTTKKYKGSAIYANKMDNLEEMEKFLENFD